MSEARTSYAGSSGSVEASSRTSMVALGLGILGVIGSFFTWDVLPGGGFVWGLPLDVAALAVGTMAVQNGSPRRWAAVTGIVLGAAMILMMLVWILADLG